MAFKPTEQQTKAIMRKGNILVSAAAGSGKTAVLVEKVFKLLSSENEAVSADRLLIVTFTKAAASEIRTRIEKRIDEAIAQTPDNNKLIYQRYLLATAKICTIDSFCVDLVRENFEKLGISADFNVVDEKVLSPINNRVLSEMIEDLLEEKNPYFYDLLDIIGAETDEKNFSRVVDEIYKFSTQLPFPRLWFEALSQPYLEPFDEKNIWWQYAFNTLTKLIDYSLASLDEAVDLLAISKEGYNCFCANFAELKNVLTYLKNSSATGDWDEVYTVLQKMPSFKISDNKKVDCIFEVAAAKQIYSLIIDKFLKRISSLFFADANFIKKQFSKLYEPLKLLTEILTEYDKRLFAAYNSANIFTFHNIEHMALNLLCEESQEKVVIKESAADLLERFDMVMVDEYQDVNDLQDMLFYTLSNREKKLFVVGDIKQSIYGFRGSNPINFLRKKESYFPVDEVSENEPQKIVLSSNFRTKPEVCDFINFFFENFMTRETGKIVYDKDEMLVAEAKYPPLNSIPTDVFLIDSKESDNTRITLEAYKIAEYIKSVMNSGKVIRERDKDGFLLREAKYSDFKILLRSAKENAPIYAEELIKLGIPVSCYSEKFIETTEISTFLSLLSVIDNPKSDIDLLCVLMSPIFSFSAEEIAEFRIGKRHGDIYSTVVNAAENGNLKAADFLKKIEKYRLLAVTHTVPKFINLLLLETGYLDIVTAFENGARCRNNLLLLSKYAEELVVNGRLTLNTFVKQISKQKEGLAAANVPSSSNCVEIMSIHRSKGLQFPVCIIAGVGGAFNDLDSRKENLRSATYGIGFKYYDEEDRTKYTTLSREVIIDAMRENTKEEELRLLYVALTRTEDRLAIFGSSQSLYTKAEALKALLIASNSEITYPVFAKCGSYLDWLISCLLIHPDGKELRGNGTGILVKPTVSRVNIKIVDGASLNGEALCNNSEETDNFNNDEIVQKIKENINKVYPYEEILNIDSKTSVSKLANKAESLKYAFSAKPGFLNKDGFSSAQKGTIMHKVMQFFDFNNSGDIDYELNRLLKDNIINDKELKVVDKELLKKFFSSDIFKRILKSPDVRREMRFLTELPATFVDPQLDSKYKNEKIMVQGAVDVCFMEEDGIVILDFKTDLTDSFKDLANAYSEQLNIYGIACSKIFNKPIKQKLIYSFTLGDVTEV